MQIKWYYTPFFNSPHSITLVPKNNTVPMTVLSNFFFKLFIFSFPFPQETLLFADRKNFSHHYFTLIILFYFLKLFSLSKNAFSSISYSTSEQTSLHRFWYSLEHSNMLLIFSQGNSAHWLHLSMLCAFVHSTKWHVQVLPEEHPSHLISSLDTMWSPPAYPMP